MLLLIDNYDSFAYNLYQLAGAFSPDVMVERNDALTADEVAALAQRYADSMATIAVAARCATHPATGAEFGDLGDVDMALEFVQKWKDRDLWDDLVRYSIVKPAFVGGGGARAD